MRRLGVIVFVAATWLGAGASPALADPAGPTDYETTVQRIEPDAGGFTVEIIGGDSFVLLTVAPGTSAEVVGYRGEPYLRFNADGSVEQNDRSPAAYLNEDRYAAVDIPADASPDADPAWRAVANDGSFAWHDHRAHWMNEAPPPGRVPGEVILEGVVPLVVNGAEVDVSVISTWQPAPSRLSVLGGALAGLLVGLAGWRLGLRRALQATALLAAAALAVGAIAFSSVPAETAPSPLLWLLPASSLALTGYLIVRTSAARAQPTILLIAVLQLVLWGWLRWEWLWRAILPTQAPYWLDRFVTATALAGGLAIAAAVVWRVAAGPRAHRQVDPA